MTKKRRYTFFIGTLSQGGGERVVSILSKKMAEQGLSVNILLYYDRPIFYELDPRVTVTTVEKETGSKSVVKNIFWIRKYFEKSSDIVISFLAPFNMLALVSHYGLKSKIIVADRNDPRYIPANKVIRKVRDWLYRFANGVVIQTTHNQEYFGDTVKKKSIIIYNPIDLGDKAGVALRTQKEEKIVSVGRLMPQKNQLMLIDAFSRVHQKHPDYKLVIYGEGSFRDNLERRIEELNLNNCVFLPGSSTSVFDEIASARLFVLSSDYEGMPNALIEAMCLGLPCVSTKVSGATDLIRDGDNGSLIDVGDEDALYRRIKQMIEEEDLRNRYAHKATELNAELNVDKIMRQWMDYLSELV